MKQTYYVGSRACFTCFRYYGVDAFESILRVRPRPRPRPPLPFNSISIDGIDEKRMLGFFAKPSNQLPYNPEL